MPVFSRLKNHDAVKKISPLPVKWVINTGGQDPRWLGNGYFAAQGIKTIAHANANAEADMKARSGEHMAGLKMLKERLEGTLPSRPRALKNKRQPPEAGW